MPGKRRAARSSMWVWPTLDCWRWPLSSCSWYCPEPIHSHSATAACSHTNPLMMMIMHCSHWAIMPGHTDGVCAHAGGNGMVIKERLLCWGGPQRDAADGRSEVLVLPVLSQQVPWVPGHLSTLVEGKAGRRNAYLPPLHHCHRELAMGSFVDSLLCSGKVTHPQRLPGCENWLTWVHM